MFYIPSDTPYHHFPEVSQADPDGVLAISEDLHPERVINAYYQGIFPWFNYDDTILWWAPDPRFVLELSELKISKSLRPYLNQKKFKVTCNTNFKEVINNCKSKLRKGQDGTWITQKMQDSYTTLHNAGFAHSIEVWENDVLVGGLYGIQVGKMFCGESMFTNVSNASKVGFVVLCKFLIEKGFKYVDCQNHTNHLEKFGAKHISRIEFMKILNEAKQQNPSIEDWSAAFENYQEL